MKYLVGESVSSLVIEPEPIFNNLIIEFISSLSSHLFSIDSISDYPDVVTFAFWCRRSHLLKLKKDSCTSLCRVGRGFAFHIAPSNVPINFAFSLVFSLLSGNVNVVRVSEKNFPQVLIITEALNELLSQPKFFRLRKKIIVVQYPRDEEYTSELSSRADVRIIWGGDKTIQAIRKLPSPTRCVDINFPDRYSISVISADAILSSSRKELLNLYAGFYNDIFLFDQNACSSPHLILWTDNSLSLDRAQNIFWQGFAEFLISKKISPNPLDALERYTSFCRNSILSPTLQLTSSVNDIIYRVSYDQFPVHPEMFKGKLGYFIEAHDPNLSLFKSIVNQKYQTVTYYGVSPVIIKDIVTDYSLLGVDRIVPIGKALDIGLVWDGLDLVSVLSRVLNYS